MSAGRRRCTWPSASPNISAARKSISSARSSTTPARTRSTTCSARSWWREGWAKGGSSPRPAPASMASPPRRYARASDSPAWSIWVRSVSAGSSPTSSASRCWAPRSFRCNLAVAHGKTQWHAASIAGGRPGVLHGNRTYLLMDEDGQIQDAHSISAGLDYPGIGPEHSWLHETGRVTYLSATDDEALAAFQLLSRLEGIIPALEPAHAIAKVMELAPKRPRDHLMVVNLSGRGDKDIPQVAEILRGQKHS